MSKFLYVCLLLWISWSVALPRPQDELYTRDDNEVVNCGGEMGAPLITPCKDSLKLDAHSNYTLECEADEPIEWVFGPEVLTSISRFNNTEDPIRQHGIRLYLMDVSVDNVGAYYCIKRSQILLDAENNIAMTDEALVELVNNELASSIYVYVNDKNNLLAQVSPLVTALQYTNVIIPCKPAMPETEVILTFNGETYSSETSGRFDPKRGFLIEIRSITDGGEYICEPKDPAPTNDEEAIYIDVRFIGNGHIDSEFLHPKVCDL